MCRRGFIKLYAFLLLVSYPLYWATTLVAADMPAPDPSNDPISITSNKMMVKSLEDIIIFEGNVFIKKGDLKILADRAEVFLTQKKTDQPKSSSSLLTGSGARGDREVSRIETSGNVDVQQGNKHAKAQKGTYDKSKEQIILTGEAEAWENDFRVKGRVITLFIAENRSLIEGSEVVIRPGSDQLKLKGK
jgi:lipopolysaccharide export system protein LptA